MSDPGKPGRRLDGQTYSVHTQGHEVAVTVAYDRPGGAVCEIAFTMRGKVGQSLDLMLSDLGVAISRLIQHRDPGTGAAL